MGRKGVGKVHLPPWNDLEGSLKKVSAACLKALCRRTPTEPLSKRKSSAHGCEAIAVDRDFSVIRRERAFQCQDILEPLALRGPVPGFVPACIATIRYGIMELGTSTELQKLFFKAFAPDWPLLDASCCMPQERHLLRVHKLSGTTSH